MSDTQRPVRTVFIVSDRTGITAETLAYSLLTQFDGFEFQPVTVPFVDTLDKASFLAQRIDKVTRDGGLRPLVFSTLVADDVREVVKAANCQYLDFFDAFIGPLERELQVASSHASGRAHGMHDGSGYARRIDAMNFALANDDGATTRQYALADVILVGVSRAGKTPTCLYLALQYGVFAANYPLTEDDLQRGDLPLALGPHRSRLYGLTISPARLRQLRHERRPDSRYASVAQVEYEIREAENLFRRYAVPFLDVTHSSIEEIAVTVLHERGLRRRHA